MLRQIAAARPGLGATTQPAAWQAPSRPLLLAEAFVSADGKPPAGSTGQHFADAAAAGRAFLQWLEASSPTSSGIRCDPEDPFNLLAAMALWAGLRIDRSELHQEVLVVAACRKQ